MPTLDVTTATAAAVFISTRIAHFGCPQHVTTNHGHQFTPVLFHLLTEFCGADLHLTSSYHPVANGMVERLHHTLKAAHLCHNNNWTTAMPLVLLGLSVSHMANVEMSTTDHVYGQPLAMLDNFLEHSHLPAATRLSTPLDSYLAMLLLLFLHSPTLTTIPCTCPSTHAALDTTSTQLNPSPNTPPAASLLIACTHYCINSGSCLILCHDGLAMW
ncbi:uncharacterized protein LOC124722687 [Schistocerca piceifrons]|uniref:uncharacterized protein LOC124722687 n=1 Tax=Schistocerca piceifrons TaxID=274613 RepID=UPI001F5EA886|nr:uncharacterized protein LOC124722687 [Schistocerca piceifrons]